MVGQERAEEAGHQRPGREKWERRRHGATRWWWFHYKVKRRERAVMRTHMDQIESE